MQFAAINWHVWKLTGLPLALGAIGLVRILPVIVFSLVGGVAADALDRRRLLMLTQSVMMVLSGLLALATLRSEPSVFLIYAVTSLRAAAGAVDNPARQALIPNLVPRERLANALSLNIINWQTATIVGPTLAGFVLAARGPGVVYAINAVSFLAVLAALALIRTSGRASAAQKVSLAALREGLDFVRRSPLILSPMMLDFVATFFSSANSLLPIFASDVLRVGATGYGLLYAAPAIGSVVTSATLSLLPRLRRQGPILLGSVALYGLATLAFGLSRWYVPSLIFLGITGAADTVSMVVRGTLRQLVTPDELRGRMTSVNMVFFMGGPQLGELEAGAVAQAFGAPLSVVTGGLGCLLAVALLAARSPQLRHYDGE